MSVGIFKMPASRISSCEFLTRPFVHLCRCCGPGAWLPCNELRRCRRRDLRTGNRWSGNVQLWGEIELVFHVTIGTSVRKSPFCAETPILRLQECPGQP